MRIDKRDKLVVVGMYKRGARGLLTESTWASLMYDIRLHAIVASRMNILCSNTWGFSLVFCLFFYDRRVRNYDHKYICICICDDSADILMKLYAHVREGG